jgi:hypothetical protein
MTVYAIDHVQIAMPANEENLARAFYGEYAQQCEKLQRV